MLVEYMLELYLFLFLRSIYSCSFILCIPLPSLYLFLFIHSVYSCSFTLSVPVPSLSIPVPSLYLFLFLHSIYSCSFTLSILFLHSCSFMLSIPVPSLYLFLFLHSVYSLYVNMTVSAGWSSLNYCQYCRDAASGADRHLDITFGLQLVESSSYLFLFLHSIYSCSFTLSIPVHSL